MDTLKNQVLALRDLYEQRHSTRDELIVFLCRYWLHQQAGGEEDDREVQTNQQIIRGVNVACHYLDQVLSRGEWRGELGHKDLDRICREVAEIVTNLRSPKVKVKR